MPTRKAVSAMSETLSSVSAVDAAARAQNIWFVVYIVVLLAAAALIVVLRQSTNRYQALVKADADARIAESNERAAHADENSARANERAEALEKDNLILRKDVNEAASKVAGAHRDAAAAQKDAADAKVAQQRVEVELAKVGVNLAKQQERAAVAERDLLDLRERLKPRVLSSTQRARLVESLKQISKESVEVFQVEGDREVWEFAEQIAGAFRIAGWDSVSRSTMLGASLRGICIAVRDLENAPPHAAAIQHSFAAVGIEMPGIEQAVPEGAVRIIVGTKP